MKITHEQYKLMQTKCDKAIREAVNVPLSDDVFAAFVFDVIGDYKDKYDATNIFDEYYDAEHNSVDWESWEESVLESWENTCKVKVGDNSKYSVTVYENIWLAMQTIPDEIKEILDLN